MKDLRYLMKKVYIEKNKCCACGVCAFICPKQAISMECDDLGFIFPVINQNLCVDCGACIKACSYNKGKKMLPSSCYAGISADKVRMMQSSSGGIFSGLASEFLKDGVVCGAAIQFNDHNRAEIKHILIDDIADLKEIQGSKYVQSYMWKCLSDMRDALKDGKKVLFSGTPCQVDGIKFLFEKYLGTQLYTIDIICHGVPNQQFFNDYLKQYKEKNGIKLAKFDFRNKRFGWGLDGIAVGTNGKELKVTTENSSYYRYFLNGEIYRENCYNCPYACQGRVGDITIGDYWGVEKYDPQLLDSNGGQFSKENGISCILINSKAGEQLIKDYGKKIDMEPVEIEHVLIVNTQLREPARYSKVRNKIFSLYQNNGYVSVEAFYRKQMLWKKVKNAIKKRIPKLIKVIGKKVLYR